MRSLARFAVALALTLPGVVVASAPRTARADGPPTLGVTARVPPAPARIALIKGKPPQLAGVVAERHADGEGAGWAELAPERGVHRCLAHVAAGQSLRTPLRVEKLTFASDGDVAFVRSEWLRLDADKNAHLEREDFFFDPRTLGMKLAERSTVELSPLAAAAAPIDAAESGGELVYGYRAGDAWHLIVATGDGDGSIHDRDASPLPTKCGHAHVIVDASAPGGGSTATLTVGRPGAGRARGPRKGGQASGQTSLRVLASASRTSRDRDAVLSIVVVPSSNRADDDDVDISAFAMEPSAFQSEGLGDDDSPGEGAEDGEANARE